MIPITQLAECQQFFFWKNKNSANVKISLQNFLTFSFNPFASFVQNLKVVPSASSKLLNLNQDHPSKKAFFWSNSYKIVISVTCLIEIPESKNFGHMTTSTIWFEPCDNFFFSHVIDKNYNVIIVISKYFYFKKGWCSQFCWHHQNFNHFY